MDCSMFFFSIITHKGRTNDAVAPVGNIRLCTDLGTHAEKASMELQLSLCSWRKIARWSLNLSIFYFIISHENKGNKPHNTKYFCGVNACLKSTEKTNKLNSFYSSWGFRHGMGKTEKKHWQITHCKIGTAQKICTCSYFKTTKRVMTSWNECLES